jgi:glycine/D-amino acid oxidase-like deaminating enzyme
MLDFKRLSYWEQESFINHTDYLIVGSGIVGLSTAISLKEREPYKKVTLIERGYLPTGASTKNAGFACIGSPSELLDDLAKSSEEKVFSTVAKRHEGLKNLREMLGDEKIDFQQNGSYELFGLKEAHLFKSCEEKLSYLNRELEKATGFQKTFCVDNTIIEKSNFKGFNNAISNQLEGQIDTGKMMRSLLTKAQSLDVLILNQVNAIELFQDYLQTNYGKIKFTKIGICTNGFAKQLLQNIDLEPARAQVMVTSPINNLSIKGIFHFQEGYYYFRNIGDRVLFGGGRNINFESEKTENTENTIQITTHLESILRTSILPNNSFTITHTWAGIMGVGSTKEPIIKALSEKHFCGIRMGGMGIAIGSLVGKELAKKMLG